MCGRPVFVLVVGAAVCCMLNKSLEMDFCLFFWFVVFLDVV